jgi:hypothetical protein
LCIRHCSDPELSVGNCLESIPRRGRKHLVISLCVVRDQVTQPLGIEPENRNMQALTWVIPSPTLKWGEGWIHIFRLLQTICFECEDRGESQFIITAKIGKSSNSARKFRAQTINPIQGQNWPHRKI